MGAAFVQGKGNFAGTGAFPQLAYNSSVTKGDLLVAAVQAHGATGTFDPGTITISDSLGSAWVLLEPKLPTATAGNYSAWGYSFAASTGACTVFVRYGSATNLAGTGINITEFSGVNAFDQYSLSSTTYSGGSQSFVSPTVTPSSSVGVAIVFSEGGSVPSSFVGSNGFTDNYGFWLTSTFVDQNWETFSTAAAQQSNIAVTTAGSIVLGRVAIATFVLSSARLRSQMGVGL